MPSWTAWGQYIFGGNENALKQEAEREARAAVIKAAGGNKALEQRALALLEKDLAGLAKEQEKDAKLAGLGSFWDALLGFFGDLNKLLKVPQGVIRYAVPIAAVAALLWFLPQIATGARVVWKRLRSVVK